MTTAFTFAFSLLLVAVGAVVLVETALLGGGVGYLLGALFLLAGAGRLYLGRRVR